VRGLERRHRLGGVVRKRRFAGAFAVGITEHLSLDDIDHAVGRRPDRCGIAHRRDPDAERRFDVLDQRSGIEILLVYLVDEEGDRATVASREVERLLGADIETGGPFDGQHRRLAERHARGEFSRKVEIAGDIDERDEILPVFHGTDGGRDGYAAVHLLFGEVGNGVAVLDGALPVYDAGMEKERFDERRLAGSPVTGDAHILDFVTGVGSHNSSKVWYRK